MTILQKIKEVFFKMFHREIQNSYKTEVLTSEYINSLKLWADMYTGSAPWTNKFIDSLRLETGICRELSNVALSEMTVKANNKKIDGILQETIENLDVHLQKGLALGAFIVRPLGSGSYEFISAENFVPLKYDKNGKLLSVVLIDTIEKDGAFYRRLEKHEVSPSSLTITNTAYISKIKTEIGKEIPLASVPEWASLPENVSYNINKMDLGYFRTPLANDIDGSQAPVSVYQTSTDLIKQADKLSAHLSWEFESGERVVHVDDMFLAPADVRNPEDNKGKVMPELNRRLYRGLNIRGLSANDALYKEYSPEFREQNILNGLNSVLRRIEFNAGLAYGDLSDLTANEKTAEEIRTSKQRKYNTVNSIQRKLKECIEDFVFALSFYEGCINANVDVACNFNDSILTSEKEEREIDKQDVALGIMSVVEYRMKWYGETEAIAKRALKASVIDYEMQE